MKAISQLLVAFIVACIFSCADECNVQPTCADRILAEYGMVPYNGQKIACNLFMTLYERRGQQYFQLMSHCADMISRPFDCQGIELCQNVNEQQCRDFHENAIELGVVGMRVD
jgi:hypothetical protein